jgi:2-oxoglutarate dehydrogenase E1 component
MGFELGYSLEDPAALVMWEAQFGDFFNGAQIIVDQFLSSGEAKWLRQSGLVLLLPHGFEGQGPEHSSARLERFLQQTDDDPDTIPENEGTDESRQIQSTNWQVVNCSMPGNYFHVLRRQQYRQFRKPLVIMTPKSLLRDERSSSSYEDMGPNTSFVKMFGETHMNQLVEPSKVRRLVFCTGKVYFDLIAHRNLHKIKDVAVARVEQIAPFPFSLVAQEAQKFPNAEIVWCQEEPKNMGAYTYVFFRIRTALRGIRGKDGAEPRYVGRKASASPAAGKDKTHKKEQAAFVAEAFA